MPAKASAGRALHCSAAFAKTRSTLWSAGGGHRRDRHTQAAWPPQPAPPTTRTQHRQGEIQRHDLGLGYRRISPGQCAGAATDVRITCGSMRMVSAFEHALTDLVLQHRGLVVQRRGPAEAGAPRALSSMGVRLAHRSWWPIAQQRETGICGWDERACGQSTDSSTVHFGRMARNTLAQLQRNQRVARAQRQWVAQSQIRQAVRRSVSSNSVRPCARPVSLAGRRSASSARSSRRGRAHVPHPSPAGQEPHQRGGVVAQRGCELAERIPGIAHGQSAPCKKLAWRHQGQPVTLDGAWRDLQAATCPPATSRPVRLRWRDRAAQRPFVEIGRWRLAAAVARQFDHRDLEAAWSGGAAAAHGRIHSPTVQQHQWHAASRCRVVDVHRPPPQRSPPAPQAAHRPAAAV